MPVRPFVFVVYAGAHAGVRPLYLPGVPCSMARQQHAVERPRVELAAEMRPATPYSGARAVSSLRAPLRAPFTAPSCSLDAAGRLSFPRPRLASLTSLCISPLRSSRARAPLRLRSCPLSTFLLLPAALRPRSREVRARIFARDRNERGDSSGGSIVARVSAPHARGSTSTYLSRKVIRGISERR